MESAIDGQKLLLFCMACCYAIFAALITMNPDLSLLAVAYLCVLGTTLLMTLFLSAVQGAFLTPFNIFYLCVCLFHFGQLVLYILGVNRTPMADYSLIYHTHTQDIVREGSVFMMNLTNLIALIGCVLLKDCRAELLAREPETADVSEEGAEKLSAPGWLMMTIVLALALASDIIRAMNVMTYGYIAGYNEYGANFLYYAAMLRVYVILTIIYLYKEKIWRLWWLVAYVVVYVGVMLFLIQNRGAAVIEMMVYATIYLWTTRARKKSARIRWVIFVVVAILALFLPFISSTRLGSYSGNFLEYIRDYNILSVVLMEFGGTANTLLYTMEKTQTLSQGYQLLCSLSTIVPGSSYLFGDLSNQYQFVYSLKVAGLGGSFLAEAYYNFGQSVFSYLYIALIGLVAVRTSNAITHLKQRGFFIALGYGVLFSALLSMVRGNVYSLFTSIKVIIIYFVFIKLFGRLLFTPGGSEGAYGGTRVGEN